MLGFLAWRRFFPHETIDVIIYLVPYLGLYSLSGQTSYRNISWSLESARLDVIMIVLLWNLTCRGTCQISKRWEKSKSESRGFETSRDLPVRRQSAKWIKAPSYSLHVDIHTDIHCNFTQPSPYNKVCQQYCSNVGICMKINNRFLRFEAYDTNDVMLSTCTTELYIQKGSWYELCKPLMKIRIEPVNHGEILYRLAIGIIFMSHKPSCYFPYDSKSNLMPARKKTINQSLHIKISRKCNGIKTELNTVMPTP